MSEPSKPLVVLTVIFKSELAISYYKNQIEKYHYDTNTRTVSRLLKHIKTYMEKEKNLLLKKGLDHDTAAAWMSRLEAVRLGHIAIEFTPDDFTFGNNTVGQLLFKEELDKEADDIDEQNVEEISPSLYQFHLMLDYFHNEKKPKMPYLNLQLVTKALKKLRKKCGDGEHMDEIERILMFHTKEENVNEKRHDFPLHFVLYGVPGTGKSSLIRTIVSWCGFLCLWKGAASEFNDKYAGETEKKIKEQFNRAVQYPWCQCVIEINEVDSLTPKEDPQGWKVGVLQTIQNLVSGNEYKNVSIFSDTNRLNEIAESFLREGRISRTIFMGSLSREAKIAWLHENVALPDKSFDSNFCLLTMNFTGAQIAAIRHTLVLKKCEMVDKKLKVLPEQLVEAIQSVVKNSKCTNLAFNKKYNDQLDWLGHISSWNKFFVAIQKQFEDKQILTSLNSGTLTKRIFMDLTNINQITMEFELHCSLKGSQGYLGTYHIAVERSKGSRSNNFSNRVDYVALLDLETLPDAEEKNMIKELKNITDIVKHERQGMLIVNADSIIGPSLELNESVTHGREQTWGTTVTHTEGHSTTTTEGESNTENDDDGGLLSPITDFLFGGGGDSTTHSSSKSETNSQEDSKSESKTESVSKQNTYGMSLRATYPQLVHQLFHNDIVQNVAQVNNGNNVVVILCNNPQYVKPMLNQLQWCQKDGDLVAIFHQDQPLDSKLIQLICGNVHLKLLRLVSCQLTGQQLKMLISGLPNLELLNIAGTQKLTDPEIRNCMNIFKNRSATLILPEKVVNPSDQSMVNWDASNLALGENVKVYQARDEIVAKVFTPKQQAVEQQK